MKDFKPIITILICFIGLAHLSYASEKKIEPQKTTNNPTATQSEKTLPRSDWIAHAENAASTMGKGCFHIQYPQTVFKRIRCKKAPTFHISIPPNIKDNKISNSYRDIMLGAPNGSLLSKVFGSFQKVTGVQSISRLYDEDQYTIQLNTNPADDASACENHPGCRVWQQFVYINITPSQGFQPPGIFMEYWLINYGPTCPGNGWINYGPGDCYKNSNFAAIQNYIPGSQLANVQLWGLANVNGLDEAMLLYGNDAYVINQEADILNISTVWDKAEFNVMGYNPPEAIFNSGSSLTVRIAAHYNNTHLSYIAPQCVSTYAYTAEFNNLNPKNCVSAGYPLGNPPYIEFTESN